MQMSFCNMRDADSGLRVSWCDENGAGISDTAIARVCFEHVAYCQFKSML